MSDSTQDHKNLSGTIGTQSENVTPEETAGSRDAEYATPYFRDYRTGSVSDSANDSEIERTTLVSRLAGLLYSLVTAEIGDRAGASTEATADSGEFDERASFVEQSASKAEYGNRVEAVSTHYGFDTLGQPMVPSVSTMKRARANANDRPFDTLYDPTDVEALSHEAEVKPGQLFIDPNGDRMIGVASGLDEHVGRIAPDLERLQSYTEPSEGETTPEDATEGITTTDLEIRLPDGTLVPLGEVVDDPERYSRSSIEAIEVSLALEAELRKVTDGILGASEDAATDEVKLVGHAKWLNNRYDELAASRPTSAELAETRDQRAREQRQERIRPLTELDEETHAEVCQLAHRLLSDDFDRAYEVRKSPLTLAIELAKKVQSGMDTTNALLEQADAEARNPQNVLKLGNVRYAPTKETKGRLSTQGRVAILFEDTDPRIKQAGILQDETGSVKFAIWKQSEKDELAPTSDPTDSGYTVVKHRSFPKLQEGDIVRFENVFKKWYAGNPTLGTRRDSKVVIVERNSRDTTPNSDSTEKTTTSSSTSRKSTGTHPRGESVPKNPIAYWRGAEKWIYPDVSWIPEWWKAQEHVECFEPTDENHEQDQEAELEVTG